MPTDALSARLDEASQRAARIERWTVWLRGGLWLLIAAIAAALTDLLFPLPAGLRQLVAIAWLIGAGAALWFGSRAAWRLRRRSADFFACLLQKTQPDSDDALINAVQFSRLIPTPAPSGSNTALMQAAIDRGYGIAVNVSPEAAVDVDTLRQSARRLMIAAAVLLMTALIFSGVTAALLPRFLDPFGDHPPYCPTKFQVALETSDPQGKVYHGDNVTVVAKLSGRQADRAWLTIESTDPQRRIDLLKRSDNEWATRFESLQQDVSFRIHTPDGYSKRHAITLEPTPRIRSATAYLQPPAYSRRSAYEEPLTAGAIRALVGTTITITLTANRPLSSGELTLWRGKDTLKTLTMTPASNKPEQVSAQFMLTDADRCTATVTSTDGLASRDRCEIALYPRPDTAPIIEFEEPGEDAYALVGMRIPLRVHAEDDIGVAGAQLHTAIGDRRTTDELAIDPAGSTVVRARAALDLDAMGAKPGDVITYFATATDTNPQPQRTDSALYRVTVVSQAEYAEMARVQAGMKWLQEQYLPLINEHNEIANEIEQLAKQAEKLREALQAAPPNSPLADELRKQLDELAARDRELRERAEKLAERAEKLAQSPELYDIQRHLNQQLAQMVRDLRRTANRDAAKGLADELARTPSPSNQQMTPHVERVLTDLKEDLAAMRCPASKACKANIAEPIETLEHVYKLIALTEVFKALATVQRDLADRLAWLANEETFTDEQFTELRRYGRQQIDQRDQTRQWREDFLEAAHEVERFADQLDAEVAPTTQPQDADPRTARADRLRKFAAKANEIITTFDSLAILEDMQNASDRLDAGNAADGHALAEAAAKKMISMIKKCQGVGGAGSQCLSLDIVEFGSSLSQMLQSIQNAGNGPPQLGQNAAGQGLGGLAMQNGNIRLYGPTTLGQDTNSQRQPTAGQMHLVTESRLAEPASVESIRPEQPVEITIGDVRGETVPGRYKELTEAYFRQIAEENR